MKLEEIKKNIKEDIMSEMANLTPDETGISYVMHFGAVNMKHGPRIKVSNIKGPFAYEDNFSVSVSKNPAVMTPESGVHIGTSELKKIFQWIIINYDDLMLLWRIMETGSSIILDDGTKITVGTLLNRLKRI